MENKKNTKYPLTEAGFNDLQIELYSWPDEARNAEADSVKLNFREWMISWFALQPAQVVFLNELSDKYVTFTADAVSYAIRNQLPVFLIKSDKAQASEGAKTGNAPEGEIFKISATENHLILTESSQGTVPGGHLVINIDYINSAGGL